MKISVFVSTMLLSAVILTSCGAQATGGFFDYQDSVKKVSGMLSHNGTEYGVTAYFEKTEGGKQRMRRVEYSSPESLEGVSFTLEGDSITAELDGVRIADSFFDKEGVFFLENLFFLSEEDIYSIESKDGDETVAMGKNSAEVWQVTTGDDGTPTKIVYENREGDCVFKIEELS